MFSKKSIYGIKAVLCLAANTHENLLMGNSDIALETGIREPILSKVLQHLTKKNFVASKKGRNGGFFMTEWQKNQKLIQIIKELEQTDELLDQCMMGFDKNCQDELCPYQEDVSRLKQKLENLYGRDTIIETARKLKYNIHTLIN